MRESVENSFHEFEGARGTCARIRGGEDLEMTEISYASTTYGWEGLTAIVLPSCGEIPFKYAFRGATRSYTHEYVATPKGVFRVSSEEVTYDFTYQFFRS